jgi:hypothetical protein
MRLRFPLHAAITLLLAISVHAQSVAAAHVIPVRVSTRLQALADVEPAIAKPGVPVFAKLRLKNISARTVRMVDSGYTDYDVTVADGSGKEPPLTEFGKRLPEMPILRSVGLDLEPGQEVQVTLEITKLYQLSPGTYYARVDRHTIVPELAEEFGKVDEKAFFNPVQFTILP